MMRLAVALASVLYALIGVSALVDVYAKGL